MEDEGSELLAENYPAFLHMRDIENHWGHRPAIPTDRLLLLVTTYQVLHSAGEGRYRMSLVRELERVLAWLC